jgi:Type IV secretory pathway, VirB3-like protein
MRPKLLMGCELELAKLFITATVLCFMLAIIKLSLGWLLLSVLFGGPLMIGARMLGQEDEDYVKVYLEALQCPHIRAPE